MSRSLKAAIEAVKVDNPAVPRFKPDGSIKPNRPREDLERYKDVDPLWKGEPQCRTTAELKQARKAAQHPDITCDLDGDGTVGTRDYLISSYFDKDHDGRLKPEERKEALQALRDGFMDNFAVGLEASGTSHVAIYQQMGGVYTADNDGALNSLYPPLPMASVVPAHGTRSELLEHRLLIKKTEGDEFTADAMRKKPRMTPERTRLASDYVANPPIQSVSERAEADQQAVRVTAGLLPVGTFVNPVREEKRIGLDWIEQPPVQTRKQLEAVRRKDKVEQLETKRIQYDDTHVPADFIRATKDQIKYEFRDADAGKRFTRSELLKNRRSEFVEYNQDHFEQKDEGAGNKNWFDRTRKSVLAANREAVKNPQDTLTKICLIDGQYKHGKHWASTEVPFKVNQIVPDQLYNQTHKAHNDRDIPAGRISELIPPQLRNQDSLEHIVNNNLSGKNTPNQPSSRTTGRSSSISNKAQSSSAAAQAYDQGYRVVAPIEPLDQSAPRAATKRWTTDIIERKASDKPHLVAPQTLNKDVQPLEDFSSFSAVRSKAEADLKQSKDATRMAPSISMHGLARQSAGARQSLGMSLPKPGNSNLPGRSISGINPAAPQRPQGF